MTECDDDVCRDKYLEIYSLIYYSVNPVRESYIVLIFVGLPV